MLPEDLVSRIRISSEQESRALDHTFLKPLGDEENNDIEGLDFPSTELTEPEKLECLLEACEQIESGTRERLINSLLMQHYGLKSSPAARGQDYSLVRDRVQEVGKILDSFPTCVKRYIKSPAKSRRSRGNLRYLSKNGLIDEDPVRIYLAALERIDDVYKDNLFSSRELSSYRTKYIGGIPALASLLCLLFSAFAVFGLLVSGGVAMVVGRHYEDNEVYKEILTENLEKNALDLNLHLDTAISYSPIIKEQLRNPKLVSDEIKDKFAEIHDRRKSALEYIMNTNSTLEYIKEAIKS